MNKLDLLEKMVGIYGQSTVAKTIGYSPSAVNQALHGKYKGRVDALLQCVNDTYGVGTVVCPVMGEISIQRCADERKKPFAASSPQRVRLFIMCRKCMIPK